MKRFVMILSALLLAMSMFGCDSTEDIPVPVREIEQMQRSSLVLGIADPQLRVGELGVLELTVWCDASVTEDVTVTDERGDVVATLANDGTGVLKGSAEILEEEPRFGSLTATSQEHRSQTASFRVTPEVTEEQVQILSEVVTDLAGEVEEQGFADPDSPEALEYVQEILTKDSRVSGYTCYDGMILFTTTDGLVGAYSGAERNPDTFGFSDPEDVFETYKTGGDVSGQYLFGDNTVSNTKGLFLVPDTGDRVVSKYYGYYEERIGTFMESVGGSCQNVHDAQAHDLLYSGAYNDCGMMLINTHGICMPRADGDPMLMIQLSHWDYHEGSLSDYMIVGDQASFYGSHETPEHNRVVFLVATEKIDENTSKNVVIPLLTSEALMASVGDKTFDNTVVFFIVCYAARDTRLLQCYLDHGASAFIGSDESLNSGVAAYEISRITRLMGTADDNGDYPSFNSLVGGEYDPKHEADFYADVQLMIYQVNSREASGQELNQQMDDDYRSFEEYMASSPMTYHLSVSDKVLAGMGTLTGTVKDRDRTHVTGAKVTLLRWLDHAYTVQRELITDDTGTFATEDLPYGIYVIEAEKDGVQKYMPWIFQPGKQEANTLFFPFTSVTGTVTVKETGAPAVGAMVTVTDGIHTYRTTTGEDGTYLISAVPDGQYTVTAALDELVCDPQSLYTGTGVLGPIRIDIQLKENNARMLLIEYLNKVLIPELGLSGFGEFDIGDPHRYDTFGAFYLHMRGISGAHIRDFDGDGVEEMVVAYLRTVSDPDPSNMYPLLGLELSYYDVDDRDQVRTLAQQDHHLTSAYDYGTYGACVTEVDGQVYVTVSSYMYDDYSNATATVAIYSMTEDAFRKEDGYLLSSFSSGATLKQFGGDESERLWKLYNGTVEEGSYTDIVQVRGSINAVLETYQLPPIFDRLCSGETLIRGDTSALFFSLMEIVANGPTATGYVHRLQMNEYLLDP